MNLILCMAGLYQRFRDAGYAQPKYLLPWRGMTILDHVLRTMTGSGAFSRLLLVANRRDEAQRAVLGSILSAHGFTPADLDFIDDTSGQAETALIGLDRLVQRADPQDRRVVFHNIDTILIGRDYAALGEALAQHDGCIDTFTSSSAAYSYVVADAQRRVTGIAEKVVISSDATTGMYGFASIDGYRAAYERCRFSGRERYISEIYRSMIDGGASIYATPPATAGDTIVLGTPAEYEARRIA